MVKLSAQEILWWIFFISAVVGILGTLNIIFMPTLAGKFRWVVAVCLVFLLVESRRAGLL